ncbi:MAG: biopolymer transporter ExbD [Calditrichaceae bacterium]|nr:biopolymer transporter ExbD [Calditrichia bacterium]NUQ39814.1 biopolymer transporter ExbD [Calditrichaceae bacterium]
MAFKPSQRSHTKIREIPLDIRPVMNLMVCLIPILLYSAEFVKLSIRELNLPPAGTSDRGNQNNPLTEQEKRFQLTVIISKRGFYIGNRAGYLTGEANTQAEPAIPAMEGGNYDFERLRQQLIEIKEKIKDQGFVDENSIIISAEADIEYKHIIRLMDYITIYTDAQGNEKELFPQINIGTVI